MNSDIYKVLSPKELLLTLYWPFSINHRDGCVKMPADQQLWNIQTSLSGTNNQPTFKSLKSPFFSVLMLGLNFSRSSWSRLHAVEQVYLIKWLQVYLRDKKSSESAEPQKHSDSTKIHVLFPRMLYEKLFPCKDQNNWVREQAVRCSAPMTPTN